MKRGTERKGVRRGGASLNQRGRERGKDRGLEVLESCTLQRLMCHISGNLWILPPCIFITQPWQLVWKTWVGVEGNREFSGPGSTSSSFPHQNRELADTIYSRDSRENNHSWKKLNHTPIKIAFNQWWCLMKSALKGSTKINSHCIPVHYALCTHLNVHTYT